MKIGISESADPEAGPAPGPSMLVPPSRVVRQPRTVTAPPSTRRDEALQPGVDDRLARPVTARPGPGWDRGAAARAAGPILALALWWAASLGGAVIGPADVWQTARSLGSDSGFLVALAASAERGVAGLALGAAAGAVLALTYGLSRWGRYLEDRTLQLLPAFPGFALLVAAALWGAVVGQVEVAAVATVVALAVLRFAYVAVTGVDTRFVDLATSLGLRRRALIRRVLLPGSVAGLLSGLRLAGWLGWVTLAVTEQASGTGLGALIDEARVLGRAESSAVVLAVYVLLALGTDLVLRWLGGRVTAWQPHRPSL